MNPWPRSYDITRGKQSRIRMLKDILADNGGRIKYDVLKNQLRAMGYIHLIERLGAMGLFVDDDGYVREVDKSALIR